MPRSGSFLTDDDKATDDRQTDCFTPCVLPCLPYFTSLLIHLAFGCNGLPLSQVCMCLWGTTYCSRGPFMMTQVVLGDHLCRGTS